MDHYGEAILRQARLIGRIEVQANPDIPLGKGTAEERLAEIRRLIEEHGPARDLNSAVDRLGERDG
jgi:hypothetical protein